MKNVDFTIHSNKAAQWLYEYRIKKFYISFLFQEAETWRIRYWHFIMLCVCVYVCTGMCAHGTW